MLKAGKKGYCHTIIIPRKRRLFFLNDVNKNNKAEKLKDLQAAADYFLKNSYNVGMNYDNL